MIETKIEHGIRSAYCALAPIGHYRPVLSCLCGFSTGKFKGKWAGMNENWEDSGSELDEHLAVERGRLMNLAPTV